MLGHHWPHNSKSIVAWCVVEGQTLDQQHYFNCWNFSVGPMLGQYVNTSKWIVANNSNHFPTLAQRLLAILDISKSVPNYICISKAINYPSWICLLTYIAAWLVSLISTQRRIKFTFPKNILHWQNFFLSGSILLCWIHSWPFHLFIYIQNLMVDWHGKVLLPALLWTFWRHNSPWEPPHQCSTNRWRGFSADSAYSQKRWHHFRYFHVQKSWQLCCKGILS